MVIYSDTSAFLRPMKRLIEKMVFLGFVSRCRLAVTPTRRSPSFANATTEGVVRPPSAFSITVGSPPSRTAMHEFVVPRSMPMVFAMFQLLLARWDAKNLRLVIADLQTGTSGAAGRSGTADAANGRFGGRGGAG